MAADREPVRPPASGSPRVRKVSASDAAGAGVLMLAVNAVAAGIGAGIGALLGALVPFLLAGVFVGFGCAIAVVIRRFGAL